MTPVDTTQEEEGLYQPPRPPLPAPTPYTQPSTVLSSIDPTNSVNFRPATLLRHASPIQNSSSCSTTDSGSSNCIGIPLPGLTSGPPPPYVAVQPLPLSRYQPFQPVPQYRPPPNPRVGAAGVPPSLYEESKTSNSCLPPVGAPGSLSCPTSLSLQGIQNTSQPRTSASGLSDGTTVPSSGCCSLPQDTSTNSEVSFDNSSPNHNRGASVPAVKILGGKDDLKTRSLPTRCTHGSRLPVIGRRTTLSSQNQDSDSPVGGGDGFLYNQTLTEESEDEDLYGSSGDLSSGSSILEKLMVWAYYNSDEAENDTGTQMYACLLS